MVAATGMVGAAVTTEGVAITVAATAIVHHPKARDPEAAMAQGQAAVGMAIRVAAAVAVVLAQAPADLAAITAKTAVSVAADTADRAAAIAE